MPPERISAAGKLLTFIAVIMTQSRGELAPSNTVSK
jgi:hypothetical protein